MALAARAESRSELRAEVSLDWLVGLRWRASAAMLAVALASWRGLPTVSAARALAVLLGLVASNLALSWLRRRPVPPRPWSGAALALDTLLLTSLLHGSGGASNPFSILYLVFITLAALMLGARWTWFLAALCVGCYAWLFTTLEHLDHQDPAMRLHLQGMWVAFSFAAILTAHFVVRMSAAIERRDAEMAAMRDQAAHYERLASVTALAAGAAHELGTPLATIAVASRELERSIAKLQVSSSSGLREDAALIRAAVDRCRAILGRLGSEVGQPPGEAPVRMTANDLLEAVISETPEPERGRLDATAAGQGAVSLPRNALIQAIQNLLRNAFDASAGRVELRIEAGSDGLRAVVHDAGAGMSPEVLSRIGEPFFSTKAPGAGLGLGVFIVRSLCEQMGGGVHFESAPSRGTTATIRIPVAA
jgi:two-component system sensor histidine kinase RegB